MHESFVPTTIVLVATETRELGSPLNKHCVVGAGFAGLPVVKKLLESGDEVVVLDFPSKAQMAEYLTSYFKRLAPYVVRDGVGPVRLLVET